MLHGASLNWDSDDSALIIIIIMTYIIPVLLDFVPLNILT